MKVFSKTRPDTRAGGQGPYSGSLEHLGRSSDAKNRKNIKKVKCDRPTDRWTKLGVESRSTRLKLAMLVPSISMYSGCRRLGNTGEFLLG